MKNRAARLSCFVLAIASAAAAVRAQQIDHRTFPSVPNPHAPGVYAIALEVSDDLPGPADRTSRIAVHKLSDSLYLRVIPESHTQVRRGAFAYVFQLAEDSAGRAPIPAIGQPGHGPSADLVRAADFRNSDNTGPNAVGPKNVNAAGELRTIGYADQTMEIRVLSFDIVGLGPTAIPAFADLSCLVTVRPRARVSPQSHASLGAGVSARPPLTPADPSQQPLLFVSLMK